MRRALMRPWYAGDLVKAEVFERFVKDWSPKLHQSATFPELVAVLDAMQAKALENLLSAARGAGSSNLFDHAADGYKREAWAALADSNGNSPLRWFIQSTRYFAEEAERLMAE